MQNNIINELEEQLEKRVLGIASVRHIEDLYYVRFEVYTPNYSWSMDIDKEQVEATPTGVTIEAVIKQYKEDILSHFIRS